MKLKSKILVIAGSDSSGGAGIQADIKTITSLGSYAMTAITAITSQNTTGVLSISKVPINEIKRQIEFTSKDIRPDAIKIGMLHSKKVIETVINYLKKIKVNKIILDPVMVAKGGTKLVDDKSIINSKKSKTAIRKSKKMIKSYGRMLVRKSGTEPIIRIMGESNNIVLLKRCIDIVKRSLN